MASKTQPIKPDRIRCKTPGIKPTTKSATRTADLARQPVARMRKAGPKPTRATAETPPANKQALLVSLLRSESGATITQMAEATGWQHHTIRGTISGVLRKKMKLNVITEKADGGSIYRVVEPLSAV